MIDAGWYTGADTAIPSDFDQGLGTWQVDLARFPSGMAALKDYVHGLGMKFGIWVEPERVNRSVITLSDGSAALLSPQAEFSNGPTWDVLQETSVDGGVLLYAFENGGAGSDSTNVRPKDLQPGVTYAVRSADAGALGEATGADLMANGIAVTPSPTSASHLLMLVPEP